MKQNPFPVTPELTAIAVAYHNSKMIADGVLPRVPVRTKTFKYLKYPLGTFFTVPDTKVGRKSAPNQVELDAEETEASCVDHGLDDPVPNEDIQAAASQANLPNPLMKSTQYIMKLVELGREKRVADLVFNDANYATNNKKTLSGTSQWSHASSDPINEILTALDAMVMRGNILVLGRAVWTKLSQHSKIVKATYGDNTDAGVARRRDVAELLELDDILVGEGWINTAQKGQTPTLVRVWGKHAVLMHQDPEADTDQGTTFGFTGEWGSRIAGSIEDEDIGLRGGQRVRAGESVKELLTANDLGYMFKNAVA